jgi:hypothetical protein
MEQKDMSKIYNPTPTTYAYVDRPVSKPKKPNKGLKIGSYSSKAKKKRQ